jgi:hypothetical protein
MEQSDFDPAFTQIRRTKKAITDPEWIQEFLHKAPVGVIATVFQDQPFMSTKLFVYDSERHRVYFHAATEGRMLENLRLNPKVCFTAYKMGRLKPAARARSFGVEYESVIVFGKMQIVTDPQEMIEILQKFMDKYASQFHPGSDYPTIEETELDDVAVFQLVIDGWSAKRDHVEENYPGAYRYEDIVSG